MAKGMLVDLIPNFDKLEDDVEGKKMKKKVDVESDGAPASGGKAGGGKGGMPGGGGGMMDMAGSIGKLLAIIGPIMFIAKALSGMAQIQAMMKMLTTFIQLLLMPFVNMLFSLFKPILVEMIKLMPAWLDFWKDPVGNLWGLVKGIGEFIWNALAQLPSLIMEGITSLGDAISNATKGFNEWVVENLGGDEEDIEYARQNTAPWQWENLSDPSNWGLGWLTGEGTPEATGEGEGGVQKQETHIHTEGRSDAATKEIIKKEKQETESWLGY